MLSVFFWNKKITRVSNFVKIRNMVQKLVSNKTIRLEINTELFSSLRIKCSSNFRKIIKNDLVVNELILEDCSN